MIGGIAKTIAEESLPFESIVLDKPNIEEILELAKGVFTNTSLHETVLFPNGFVNLCHSRPTVCFTIYKRDCGIVDQLRERLKFVPVEITINPLDNTDAITVYLFLQYGVDFSNYKINR
jgi:hypothetical protein